MAEFLLVYLRFQDLSYEPIKPQSLLLSQLRNFKNCSIKFYVVTLKNIPFPVSHIKLYAPFCPDADNVFSQLYFT